MVWIARFSRYRALRTAILVRFQDLALGMSATLRIGLISHSSNKSPKVLLRARWSSSVRPVDTCEEHWVGCETSYFCPHSRMRPCQQSGVLWMLESYPMWLARTPIA